MASESMPTEDVEVVVTGMSGRFPECRSVEEFWQKLVQGEDLITDDDRRWKSGSMGAPPHSGKLPSLSQFDADFFRYNPLQADSTDPQGRILLELTYEAIFDAGVNPSSLRGSKTGVFVGACFNDAEGYSVSHPELLTSSSLFGVARSILANRISYAFDLTGPSLVVDTACSSSLYALESAVASVKSGRCDSAIVAGTNILLNPLATVSLASIGAISPDGRCKSFDAGANGYVRSEGIAVLFIQRAHVARRKYATIVHLATNCDGYKKQSMAFPSRHLQARLLADVYKEANISTDQVSYIEAHGTGTKVGDPEEVNAIAHVFCERRTTPLLIGSVKSNMGHAEGGSAICGLVKLLLSIKHGELTPNLHYNSPNPRVPHLVDGRIQVVTSRQPLTGDFFGLNSFGFGGSNAHVIIRRPEQATANEIARSCSVPWIVGVSGRTELAVQTLLNKVKNRPTDTDLVALLHEIHSLDIPGHLYRGSVVLKRDGKTWQQIQRNSDKQKPIWFVFSGFGCQWATMGCDLLRLSVFQSSIEKCNNALIPFKINIFDIINDPSGEELKDFRKGFVASVAIQIGLFDVLTSLGMKPDGIIGHSLGEIASAYADGCLTAEQAVISAFYRGQVFSAGDYDGGAMAAIGLSAEKASEILPPDVQIACDNGVDNVTISGPSVSVGKLVSSFKEQGVFVKEVDVGGVAFHSRLIATAGNKLLKLLRSVIPEPKPRSKRWISSSISLPNVDSKLTKTCSAEYLSHNLVSPVRFREACGAIPANAIVVELAAHGILQAVLLATLPKTARVLSLMSKSQCGVDVLATGLGKLYAYGAQPLLASLYPAVEWPVKRATPLLSPLVVWDHDKQWSVPRFDHKDVKGNRCHKYSVDLSKEDDAWYRGHQIDGKVIFPAAGYLVFAWKTLASLENVPFNQLPVTFKDVCFHQATVLPRSGEVELMVELLGSSGRFEVTDAGSLVTSGVIVVSRNTDFVQLDETDRAGLRLESHDIYKQLSLRGYQYDGVFRGVLQVCGSYGIVRATSNWVALLDAILQVPLITSSKNPRELQLPVQIREINLNPIEFNVGDQQLTVSVDHVINVVQCSGIQITGISVTVVDRRPTSVRPILEHVDFVPNVGYEVAPHDNPLELALQLISENMLPQNRLTIRDFRGQHEDAQSFDALMKKVFCRTIEILCVNEPEEKSSNVRSGITSSTELTNFDICLAWKLNDDVYDSVQDDGFMLVSDCCAKKDVTLLASFVSSTENVHLYKKEGKRVVNGISVVYLKEEESFNWLVELQAMLKSATEIVIVAENVGSGILGLVNCLRLETSKQKIRCVFIQDSTAPIFSLADSFYSDQLSLGLTMNVYKNGTWGSYRFLKVLRPDVDVAETGSAYVNIATTGDFSSFRWIQGPQLETSDGETLVHVYNSSLNFHDVMVAIGRLSVDKLPENLVDQDCVLGLEFSGRVSTGRRVMGIVPSRGIATTVLSRCVYDVPEHWSLQEAATVPVVYLTAYYGLLLRGRLRPGESVLIHAGTGGVGQAAISIALHMGCTVYTTVGSKEKRDFLKNRFHQLTDKHIGNSRDTTFEQLILTGTNGQGVNVVLNSLAGDMLMASLRCLALHGRFIEIGLFDIVTDQPLGLGLFLQNISYHCTRLDSLLSTPDHPDWTELTALLTTGITNGVVQPLLSKVFTSNQVEQAFRYLASGKNIGKVVVRIRDEEQTSGGHCLDLKPRSRPMLAALRYLVPREAVCVITGGLGGFGLQLADWLISRGARHLVLTSRTGECSGYKALCMRRWKQAGAVVTVSTADVTTEVGATELLSCAGKMGDITAIFHLAVILQDGFLENQTEENFRIVWGPKTSAMKNLDVVSRRLCPALKHFVLFSSGASGRGNPGQCNYAMASSAAERIIESRHSCGYPGLAVQWGPIADVGLAANLKMAATHLIALQSVKSCLETLEMFLLTGNKIVASTVINDARNATSNGESVDTDLIQVVSIVLGILDIRKEPAETKLSELGMDSLMQVEIRTNLERYRAIALSSEEIRSLTVGKLLEIVDSSKPVTKTKEPVGSCKTPKTDSATSEIYQRHTGFALIDFKETPLIPDKSLVVLNSALNERRRAVFLVHPIEGHCRMLEEVSRHVNCTVYGIQFTRDAPQITVKELAHFYIQCVQSVQPEGPYVLGGYSLGVLIAVEMALQLERQGQRTSLVALDGVPQYEKSPTDQEARAIIKTLSEVELCTHFVSQLKVGVNRTELGIALAPLEWPDKLEKCLDTVGIPRGSDRSAEYKQALEACHWRVHAAVLHVVPSDVKISGAVIVIAAQSGVMKKISRNNYGFQAICKRDVEMIDVQGDHKSFLCGEQRCIAIARHINKLLRD